MKTFETWAAIVGIAALTCSGTSKAALVDRGGGMIYDTVQNITWLADLNYAQTSGFDSDGRMSWATANAWANALVFNGYSGWRLPTSDQCYGNCTGSEMGHLFMTDLGDRPRESVLNPAGDTLQQIANLSMFSNVQSYNYWSGTDSVRFAPGFAAMEFSTSSGDQNAFSKDNLLYAVAVHSGDVGAPPTASTLAKLSSDSYGSNLGADGYQFQHSDTGNDGFAAAIYKNVSTNQVVVAVRGTDVEHGIGLAAYNMLADSSLAPGSTANILLSSYIDQLVTSIKRIHDNDPSAQITLTGHSLGGSVAQVVGNAAGVAVTSFDAPGARNALTSAGNANLLTSLNGYVFNTPSTSIVNYRLQGDQFSLIGKSDSGDSQFGNTISVPNPHPILNSWRILSNHSISTLASQIQSQCGPASSACINGYTSEPNLTGNFIRGAQGLCNAAFALGRTPPAFCQDFLFPVLAVGSLFLDPAPGNLYAFQEETGSPFIEEVRLPTLSAVFGWGLSYHDQFGWSSYVTQMGDADFLFTTDVDAFSFIPLDGLGRQTFNTDYFAYGLTFASDGMVRAQQAIFGSAPEPSDLVLALTALGVLIVSRKRWIGRRLRERLINAPSRHTRSREAGRGRPSFDWL